MPVAPPSVATRRDASYHHLARALSAHLRRQILLAVCEAPDLRDRLNARLRVEHPADAPPLVNLELDPEQPNFPTAIAAWLQAHPQHPNAIFVVRGIEALTRQPAAVQQRFLRQLHLLDRHLPQLDFNLLLWLTRPWCNTIRDSVPEFWRWHTGLFEFASELDDRLEGPGSWPQPVATPAPMPTAATAAPAGESATARSRRRSSLQKRPGEFPLLTLAKLPPPPSAGAAWPSLPLDPDLAATAGDREPEGDLADATETAPELGGAGRLEPVATEVEECAPELDPDLATEVEIERPLEAVTPLALEPPIALSLADVERLKQSQPPEAIAQAYLQIGQQYRDRIAQGEVNPAQLSAAIQAYEQAVQWLTDGPEVADVLNDLGNFYWLRSRQPENPEDTFPDLERALSAYQLALAKLPAPEMQPETYAMIQNNLGAAYGDLARYRDLVENLQLSVQAYQAALRFRSPKADPLKYGSTQNNLGTAYWHLAQQVEPAANLRAAIQAYQAASPYYSESRDPQSWAMIENNLGTAFWNLSQYEEPAAWLPEAIAHYERSLRYRTPEALPAACAATQNNLGTAYWQFSQAGDFEPAQELDLLQRAIAAYTTATQIAQQLRSHQPPLPLSFDVAGTFNNLGSVHHQLATSDRFQLPAKQQLAHLEAGLQAHLQALSNLPRDTAAYASTLKLVARCVRACYELEGIAGQNRALAQVPGPLLPELLPKL